MTPSRFSPGGIRPPGSKLTICVLIGVPIFLSGQGGVFYPWVDGMQYYLTIWVCKGCQ
jgi:hypothetical protein